MPKLTTPVQFEPSLEGLNVVRPLIMPDECKTVISYPVLCQNLPSEGKPALGKLARCTQQGALLKSNNALSNKVYQAFVFLYNGTNIESYTFPTKVNGVLARNVVESGTCDVTWCSPDIPQSFMSLSDIEFLFLPFVGTTIYFRDLSGYLGWSYVLMYGFYK